MQWLAWAIAILAVGAVGGCVIVKDATARFIGVCGCLFGSAAGVYGAALCLLDRLHESRLTAWNVPFGSFNLGLDSLGALFLIPTLVVGAMAGLAAFRPQPGDYAANHSREYWLFLNLLLAAVVLLILARNAVLFLFAWGVMAVASFLMAEGGQREPDARSCWRHIATSHFDVVCLFAMFALLGADSERLDFNSLKASGGAAAAVFILAFVGFGGKIGLFPLHFGYAENHSRQPGHVGAVLSGVVGNMALYGFLRTLDILSAGTPPPLWWGFLLAASGLAAVLLGAVRSLASRDLARLIAWSSVENNGLMATGVALGLLGASAGDNLLSFLGFSAAMLHMANHSVAKGILFLISASIYAKSGTRMLGYMGGLAKVLPVAAALFLVGGLGTAAMPPLNGFAGGFLLLRALYGGMASSGVANGALFLAAMAVLVAAFCLAAVALAKAFSLAFLGSPRLAASYPAGRERPGQVLPAAVLAVAAVVMAAASPQLLDHIRPTVEKFLLGWRPPGDVSLAELRTQYGFSSLLSAAALGTGALLVVLAAVWAARRLIGGSGTSLAFRDEAGEGKP